MEIVKTYTDMKEYLEEVNKSKIDKMYKEAVDGALESEVVEEMIARAVTEVADSEAELDILEDLFVHDKVDKKEVTQAKRRHTKAKNNLELLLKDRKD
jgi:hypothetical protein